MQWEVEQKFRLADVEATKAKLAELGIVWSSPVDQIDHYFNHPARDFGQTDEALRIRQVGDDNFTTYKGPKVDPATKTRRELELPLPPGQKNAEKFTELLCALGFQPVASVKKRRQQGEVTWQGHRVDVALDDVEHVGLYVELEIAADETSLASAKSALQSLSQGLNPGTPERRSYLELLPGGSP